MQDRFKFRAIVKGYYYIDKPDKCEEFEPLIFLENIDVLDIGDIGISEEDLEIAIRKQYPDLQDIYVERMMENFRDNSNGVDTYITITPEQIYQCTGLKDKNGKLIYEGDIVRLKAKNGMTFDYAVKFKNYCFILEYINGKLKGAKARNFAKQYAQPKILYEHGYMVIGNRYENPELLED